MRQSRGNGNKAKDTFEATSLETILNAIGPDLTRRLAVQTGQKLSRYGMKARQRVLGDHCFINGKCIMEMSAGLIKLEVNAHSRNILIRALLKTFLLTSYSVPYAFCVPAEI